MIKSSRVYEITEEPEMQEYLLRCALVTNKGNRICLMALRLNIYIYIIYSDKIGKLLLDCRAKFTQNQDYQAQTYVAKSVINCSKLHMM
jgi:hypothetical protein